MVKIALIRKNRCNFDRIGEFVVPLLHKPIHSTPDESFNKLNDALNDYIWSQLEPAITFIDLDITLGVEMMEIICENIREDFPDKNPDEFFYMTESSYSTPEYFLEFVHAKPLWKSYVFDQISNMNNIGCLMSLRHNVIENNCILIVNKYDLSAPKFVSMTDCTKFHLIEVIRRRYFHSAILIKEKTIVQYYFQNPVALVVALFNLDYAIESTDTIDTMSLTLLKYNLLFYFKQDKQKFINKCATRLIGHHKMYGEVLVFHELEDKIFSNLDIEEVRRLNLLSYGRLEDRKLTAEESSSWNTDNSNSESNEKSNSAPALWSKYLVSEHRLLTLSMSEKNNKCMYCNSKIIKLVVCPHCFRPRYCSEKCCMNDFGRYHFKECIYD